MANEVTLNERINLVHKELSEITKEASFVEAQLKQLKNREQQLIGRIQAFNDLAKEQDLADSENTLSEVTNSD